MLVRAFQSWDIHGQCNPKLVLPVSLTIGVPIEHTEVGQCRQNTAFDLHLSLLEVKEDVSVYLRLAENDLENLQILLVLHVDVDWSFTLATFFKAVVLLLKLANNPAMAASTLNAYSEIWLSVFLRLIWFLFFSHF